MKYHLLKPEIMLDIGDNTIETKQNGTEYLHVDLENWLGDDLLETSSFDYVVSERLKLFLEKSIFSGFDFETIEVTKAEYFDDNYGLDIPLPTFYWMKIIGKKNKNDFFLENKIDLYCSDILLENLKLGFMLNNLEIDSEKDNDLEDFLDKMIANRKKNLDE